ncbi:zinc-binding dehydrogenase [Streptomyces werraensis]|uniref:zinc-binding dehydrogenase n=1 Tax=Streptomyces werraensis TaxID=68284 RepID=UPI0034176BC2
MRRHGGARRVGETGDAAARAAQSARSVEEFFEAVKRVVRPALRFDVCACLTVDPQTLMNTGGDYRDGLPLAVITAWEGLVDRAGVRAGQKVLVHGGAGGVGSVAVQVAAARGAEVFATASAARTPLVRRLGAVPIDYTSVPVERYVAEHTGGAGFDIVFDTVGGPVLDASFEAVRTYTGHVVSALGWGTHPLAPLSFRAATYSGIFTLLPMLTGRGREHHGEILREAAALVHEGKLRPLLDGTRYTLADVADAHRSVESGTADGKVVVDVEP